MPAFLRFPALLEVVRFIVWPTWFLGRVLPDLAFPGTNHTGPDLKSSQLHTRDIGRKNGDVKHSC